MSLWCSVNQVVVSFYTHCFLSCLDCVKIRLWYSMDNTLFKVAFLPFLDSRASQSPLCFRILWGYYCDLSLYICTKYVNSHGRLLTDKSVIPSITLHCLTMIICFCADGSILFTFVLFWSISFAVSGVLQSLCQCSRLLGTFPGDLIQ